MTPSFFHLYGECECVGWIPRCGSIDVALSREQWTYYETQCDKDTTWKLMFLQDIILSFLIFILTIIVFIRQLKLIYYNILFMF